MFSPCPRSQTRLSPWAWSSSRLFVPSPTSAPRHTLRFLTPRAPASRPALLCFSRFGSESSPPGSLPWHLPPNSLMESGAALLFSGGRGWWRGECNFFFFLINFYWGRVASQCCVSFCCTAKWISHTYTHIPSFLISFPFRSPRCIE